MCASVAQLYAAIIYFAYSLFDHWHLSLVFPLFWLHSQCPGSMLSSFISSMTPSFVCDDGQKSVVSFNPSKQMSLWRMDEGNSSLSFQLPAGWPRESEPEHSKKDIDGLEVFLLLLSHGVRGLYITYPRHPCLSTSRGCATLNCQITCSLSSVVQWW